MIFKNGFVVLITLAIQKVSTQVTLSSPGDPLFEYYLCSRKSIFFFFSDNPRGANEEWAVNFWVKFKLSGKTVGKTPFVIFRDGQNGENGATRGLYTAYDYDSHVYKLYFESTFLIDMQPANKLNDYKDNNFDRASSLDHWYYIVVSAKENPSNPATKEIFIFINDALMYQSIHSIRLNFFYTVLHIGSEKPDGNCYEEFLMHRLEVFKFPVSTLSRLNSLRNRAFQVPSGIYRMVGKKTNVLQILEAESKLPPIQINRNFDDDYTEPLRINEPGYLLMRDAKFKLPDEIVPFSPVNRSYTTRLSFDIIATGYVAYKHTLGNPPSTKLITDFYPYLRVPSSEDSKNFATMSKKIGAIVSLYLQYFGFSYTTVLKRKIKGVVDNAETVTHTLQDISLSVNTVTTPTIAINIKVSDEVFNPSPKMIIQILGSTSYTFDLAFELADTDKHFFGSDMITADPSFWINIHHVIISHSMALIDASTRVNYEMLCSNNCMYCNEKLECIICKDRFYMSSGVCIECNLPQIWDPFTGRCFDGNEYDPANFSITADSMTIDVSGLCAIPENHVFVFALEYTTPDNIISNLQQKSYYLFANSLFYSALNFYLEEFDESQLILANDDACSKLDAIFAYYADKPRISSPVLYYTSIPVDEYYKSFVDYSGLVVEPGFPCHKFGLKFYMRTFYSGSCENECPVNTVISSDGRSCVSCIMGCKICDSHDTCLECEDGRYLDPIGICRKCVYPCVKCLGSPNNCSQTLKELVMYNFLMDNIYNYPFCLDAIPQCSRCNSLDKAICAECNPGFYLSKGVCMKSECSNVNCSRCDSNGDCIFCSIGYDLISESECMLNLIDEKSVDEQLSADVIHNLNAHQANKNSQISNALEYYESLVSSAEEDLDNGSSTCLAGLYRSGDQCLACLDGCVDCSDGLSCSACNYPFYFDETTNTCKFDENVVNVVFDKCDDCSVCFENGEHHCSVCDNCSTDCECSVTASLGNKVFSVSCPGVIFNSSFFKDRKFPGIDVQLSGDRKLLNLSFKPNGPRTFVLTFKEEMIEVARMCKFNIKHSIIITNDYFIDIENSEVFKTTSSYYENAVDTVTSVVTTININGGSQLISFVQFNQLFLFFSFLEIPIGGIYNYVNALNVSNSDDDADVNFIDPRKRFQYENMRETKKLYKLKKIDVFSYNTIGCFCLLIIAGLASLIRRVLVRRYLNLVVVNCSQTKEKIANYKNIRKFRLLKSFKIICIKIAFVLLQMVMLRKIPIVMFWVRKIKLASNAWYQDTILFLMGSAEYFLMGLYIYLLILYINKGTVKDGVFKRFDSPANAREEVIINKLNLTELLFTIVYAVILFIFFRFAPFAMFAVLSLKALETAIYCYLTRLKMLLVLIPRICTNILFMLFVILAALIYYNYNINRLVLEIIYYTVNISKILELVLTYLYIRQQNKKNKNAALNLLHI